MKNRPFYILLFVALILSACHLKDHQIIKNYEFNVNQIQVISIQSEESFMPFYAHDSIGILETKYNILLAEKLKSIEDQLKNVKLKIDKTENELEDIENPLMIAAVKSQIKLMIIDQNKIETILSIYQNTPEKTQLMEITERINYLKKSPDSLLGYTLKISFIGKQGALSEKIYQRNYLFNVNNSKIVGVILP